MRAANRKLLKKSDEVLRKVLKEREGKNQTSPKATLSWEKIQDHTKDQKFIVADPHMEPNVYNIKPVEGKGPVWAVN